MVKSDTACSRDVRMQVGKMEQSGLELCSRRGAIQIHVYVYLTF